MIIINLNFTKNFYTVERFSGEGVFNYEDSRKIDMLLYLSIFTRKSHNLKKTSLKIIISFDFDNDHLPLRYLPPRQQSLATTLTWLKTKHLFLRI